VARVSEHEESPPDDESTLAQQFRAFNSDIIIAFNSEIIIATVSALTKALHFESIVSTFGVGFYSLASGETTSTASEQQLNLQIKYT
jgi:hypothetical protein